MSVTESTGHVGNTFVEIKNKHLACKKKSDLAVGAVGMWEDRVICELSKAVRKERESVFSFPLFPHCWHFHSSSLFFLRKRLQDQLMTVESC
jgi:hypothetical protein